MGLFVFPGMFMNPASAIGTISAKLLPETIDGPTRGQSKAIDLVLPPNVDLLVRLRETFPCAALTKETRLTFFLRSVRPFPEFREELRRTQIRLVQTVSTLAPSLGVDGNQACLGHEDGRFE